MTHGNIEKLKGGIHFIPGQHKIANSEHITFGVFNDNESFTTNMNSDANLEGSDNNVELIRGIIATHKGFTVKIGGSSVSSDTAYNTDVAALTSDAQFKIQISGSVSVNEPVEVHDYLVSLDPDSINYIENLDDLRQHVDVRFEARVVIDSNGYETVRVQGDIHQICDYHIISNNRNAALSQTGGKRWYPYYEKNSKVPLIYREIFLYIISIVFLYCFLWKIS